MPWLCCLFWERAASGRLTAQLLLLQRLLLTVTCAKGSRGVFRTEESSAAV